MCQGRAGRDTGTHVHTHRHTGVQQAHIYTQTHTQRCTRRHPHTYTYRGVHTGTHTITHTCQASWSDVMDAAAMHTQLKASRCCSSELQFRCPLQSQSVTQRLALTSASLFSLPLLFASPGSTVQISATLTLCTQASCKPPHAAPSTLCDGQSHQCISHAGTGVIQPYGLSGCTKYGR